MNNSIYRENDNSRYAYHDKQISGTVDRVFSQPRNAPTPIVDPRAFDTIQQNGGMKANPTNFDNNKFVVPKTQPIINEMRPITTTTPVRNQPSGQEIEAQRNYETYLRAQNSKMDMSIEDRIAYDMANQKKKIPNKLQGTNIQGTNNDKYCSIEESCQNGICTKIEVQKDMKNAIPQNIIPCLANGKFNSNLTLLYSTDEDYTVNCDNCNNRISQGYHYGKTDLCVPCFKNLTAYIKSTQYKDPNPRNKLQDVFDDFGSIYGSSGYNNINGSPF
jgi:hypothetical protein